MVYEPGMCQVSTIFHNISFSLQPMFGPNPSGDHEKIVTLIQPIPRIPKRRFWDGVFGLFFLWKFCRACEMWLEQHLRFLVGVWLEADQYCQHLQHVFGCMFGTSKVVWCGLILHVTKGFRLDMSRLLPFINSCWHSHLMVVGALICSGSCTSSCQALGLMYVVVVIR